MNKTHEPYNPGLSEEAWEKLHALMARLSIKYSDRVNKDAALEALPRKESEVKKSPPTI